jgi:DNA-3-methyladenine glycosylase
MARRRRLPRSFYDRDAREVAPDLLGTLLVRGARVGRIVEVEAYCGAVDPGSHGYRGLTPRTRTMFGPAGHLYVYFTYGMHWCGNVVCGPEGESAAVLVRAVEPVKGLDLMRTARPKARRDRDLTSGPARVCQAFGIDGTFDGADLVRADREVTLATDGAALPVEPATSTRIGLSAGSDLPWRWYLPGNPYVSAKPR